jgi:WD40 repeat protein
MNLPVFIIIYLNYSKLQILYLLIVGPVYSLDTSPFNIDLFLSSSMDGTIRIYDVYTVIYILYINIS